MRSGWVRRATSATQATSFLFLTYAGAAAACPESTALMGPASKVVTWSLGEGEAIVILATSWLVAASNRRAAGGREAPGCGKGVILAVPTHPTKAGGRTHPAPVPTNGLSRSHATPKHRHEDPD